MAVISKGQTFATGDQVTALKLNNLADNATFASGAVDNVSTQLSGGAIVVKDGGVTTAKLNDNAVTTVKIADANVTTAKIADANVTTAKIADANVTFAKLTDVIDDDTMATATDTTLATSESIKAYVDSLLSSAIFTESFESSEINPPAANTTVSASHSLSSTPKIAQAVYRCKIADNGWSVGDEIIAVSDSDSGFGHAGLVVNSSEIKYRATYSAMRYPHGTLSNVGFSPTSPNWKLVLKAYV